MITNGDILEHHNLIQQTISRYPFSAEQFRTKINSFYNEYGSTIEHLNDNLVDMQKRYLVWEDGKIKLENGKYIMKEGMTQKDFTLEYNVFMKTPTSKLVIVNRLNIN